jgi:hypothetical protein
LRLFRPDLALTGNFDPGFSEPPRYVFQRLKIVAGNGIFGAETKRLKRLRRFKKAVAETKSR